MTYHVRPYFSFSIAFFEVAEIILLVTCQLVKIAEKKGFKKASVDSYWKEEDNNAFVNQYLLNKKSFSKKRNNSNADK